MTAPMTVGQPAIVVPEPGLYPDVPADVYHRWPAASQTVLKIMRDRSPAHARQYMLTPPEPTPAMVLGAAIHAAILQPDVFARQYVRAPELDRRTRAGREAWEQLEAEYPDATILRAQDYDLCIAVRDSVHAHPIAKKLLGGESERSVVWRDRETGVLCKGRFDHINLRMGTITDLKTTEDASPKSFQRTIWAYGYHMQGGFYMDASEVHDLGIEFYTIVAVEKQPPYAVAVYQLSPEAIQAGRQELRPLLRQWAECERTGYWPAYPLEAVEISLPDWAWRQLEQGVPF